MKKDLNLIITATLLLLVLILSMNAKPRSGSCRIFPLWIDDTGLRSSYYDDIGRFQVDGEEGETIRSFTYRDFVVTAGINYEYRYSKRKSHPYAVELAITASDKAETKIFEKAYSSEASTLDKKGWNLSVTKNIHSNDLMYMFTLSCNEGLSLPRRK